LALPTQGQILHNGEKNMEAVNLVNTIAKVETPKASNVAVSINNANGQNISLQPAEGKALPGNEEKFSHSEARSKIEDTVSDLNEFVQNIQRGIQFSVHEDTGRSIITITDKDSGDVIRRFPSEDVLAMATYLAENKTQAEDAVRGLLVNESA